MWISNTATTAMMMPIAHAVLMQISSHRVSAQSVEPQTTNDHLSTPADDVHSCDQLDSKLTYRVKYYIYKYKNIKDIPTQIPLYL